MNRRQILAKGLRLCFSIGLGTALLSALLIVFGGVTPGPVGAAPSGAATSITADIISDTTWTTGNIYMISKSQIEVRNGATLTIEPGVDVVFSDGGQLLIRADGVLTATGAPAQPINFRAKPVDCSWKGVSLQSDHNTIRYAVFEYAERAIHIDDGDFQTIAFNIFQNNGGCALSNPLSGAISGFTDSSLIDRNVFTTNNTAIYLNRSGANEITGNVISGTNTHAVFFDRSASTPSQENQIVSNTIRYAGGYGLYLAKGRDNLIGHNRVYSSAGGVSLEDQQGDSGAAVIVQDNDLYANSGSGLVVAAVSSLSASHNLIYDNDQGVQWGLLNDNAPQNYNLERNVICRDANYLFRNEDTPVVAAAPNWWGHNNPSLGLIGSGAEIQGQVTITPPMKLTAVAPVTTLPADGVSTTTLTISLRGGGVTVPPRARDIRVAPAGKIAPANSTLDNQGQGTVVYTAGLTPGPVVITVTELCASHRLTLPLTLTAVDLAVAKSSAQTQVEPGQLITYSLAYTNQTVVTAANVVITDALPGGMAWVTDTAESLGFTHLQTAPQVSWRRPTLGSDEDNVITLVALAPTEPLANCGQILTNTASITSAAVEADAGNNHAVHHGGVYLRCPPSLAITKTLRSTAPSLGKPTTFAITYHNPSAFTASNVVITDFLDTDVTFVSDTLAAPAMTATNTASTTIVVWELGSLGPGQGDAFEVDLRLEAGLASCAGGVISFTNRAAIGSDLAVAASKTISSGAIPCDVVDLVVVKNDGVGAGDPRPIVQGGERISYTISVNNLGGQTAVGVVLTETLPVGTSFVGPTGPNGWFQVGASNLYTYAAGALAGVSGGAPSGRMVDFIVRVEPNLACTVNEIINTVSAGSNGPEATPADNTVNEQTPATCHPLQLGKTTDVVCAAPGQLVEYTLAVTNTGSGAADNLLLAEALPANTLFQGPAGVWTAAGGGLYTHPLGSLAGGQTTKTGFWVQIDPAAPPGVTAITNVVRLEPDGLEATLTTPLESNAADLYVVKNDNIELVGLSTLERVERLEQKVGATPWLEAVKAAPVGAQATSAAPGDVISYTIAYGNAGDAPAANVVITETLPANTSFVGPLYWTPAGGDTYVYTVTTLAPGAGANLAFRVRIADPFPAGTIGVTNTLQIGSQAPVECDLSDNLNREFTRVEESSPGPFFGFMPVILKTQPALPPRPTPQPPPPPTPTPLPLAHVSDVAVDPTTNQVFVAGPRRDAVHVIDGEADVYETSVPVGHGPTGLAVLTSTTPSKVFVAHATALNNWTPGIWIIDSDDKDVRAMTHQGGYVGAGPVKVAANSNPGWERVYVSNYFDRLPIIAGPTETRVGWVPKKSFQASYGLDVSRRTNLIYLASIDTGELIIFEGEAEFTPNYGACHHAPPEPRLLRTVAVNQTSGHVFVASPPDFNKGGQTVSKVFVLDEAKLLEEAGGSASDLNCDWNFINGRLRIAAIPGPAWLTATIDLPDAISAGEEGLAVNSQTGKVYVTDGPSDTLFVIDFEPATASVNAITAVTVDDNPQGVDVNPVTNRVYVGNARSAGDPYGTVSVVDGDSDVVIKTIPLGP